MLPVATRLGIEPRDARLFMVADKRWKYVHAVGFRPMLYDLGDRPRRVPRPRRRSRIRGRAARGSLAALDAWGLRLSQRTTRSEQQIRDRRGKSQRKGILIGVWDESDVPDELWVGYMGEGA